TCSFPPAGRLLMVNQFAINLAFYMLMPYLAAHLSGELGLAAWAVGLVLGVRNFSQQGMFLIGGTIADRLGYKAPIMAGCLLRTIGFGLLGWVDNLPALIAASAATGFAGALFNPAVRAYLAAEAGERRIDAFATFNVYYQTGMLLGPLVGLALLAADFRLVCTTAAAIFAVLTALQWRALPTRHGDSAGAATGKE
ncbi:MFS transporter, partial [Streptomyces sp. 2MCAF27]